MNESSQADQDERVESLPWDHVAAPRGVDRRRMAVLAAAVVVAAVTASATRTLWPSAPLSSRPETSLTVESSLVSLTVPPTTESVRLVTEADLRAISPQDGASSAAAHAQWFVTEWLTIDGAGSQGASWLVPDGLPVPVLDESARSFVESAIVLSTSEVEQSQWEVAVLVRSLSAFRDGDYLRIPARVFLVTVAIGEDGPFVVDFPTPGPLPSATAPPLELAESQAPENVIAGAIDVMSEAGLVDEASILTQRSAGLWRVSGVVRDEAGVPIGVVVWTDDAGDRVPAPGAR